MIRRLRILAALGTLTVALLFGAHWIDGEDGGDVPAAADAAAVGTLTDELIEHYGARSTTDPLDFISRQYLADQYVRRARQTGDVTDYARAAEALRSSLRILESYDAQVRLALVYGYLYQFEEALALAERAVERRPLAAPGYAVLGDAQFALGRYDEAAAAYGRYAELETAGLATYSRLAQLAWLRGDVEEALRYRRAAASSVPAQQPEEQAWAQVQLGRLHRALGDLGAAEDAFNTALERFPGHVHAVAGLASVDAARGDYDDAIERYRDAVERYPDPEYVFALAGIYEAVGRPGDAAREYELLEAITRLYAANGINTDLQMAGFAIDRAATGGDRDGLDRPLADARAAYDARPTTTAADTVAWGLYAAGRYQEAAHYADEAMRFGTRDTTMLYHAAEIHAALGEENAARELIQRVLAIDPRFSVRYADEAARLHERLALKGASR